MAYASMTKPTQGDPVKKSEIDQLIDNDEYLKGQVDTLKVDAVFNGSFETPGSGTPTGWTLTLYTGGSGAIDTADHHHGDQSFKFTHPGGAGNGGGYLDSENYFEVSPNRTVILAWEQKSSAAGIRNKVELRWFTSALAFISASTLLDSTSNPTTWTLQSGSATPPSTARFAKIRITGGDSATDPGSSTTVNFDNVHFKATQIIPAVEVLTADATWTVPSGVTRVRVRAWGAGGGGGGGVGAGGNAGSGGGGGAYAEIYSNVTPGTSYTATVGTGGPGGGASTAGTAGENTSLGALVTANGGSGGASNGAAGAGGTATATSTEHRIAGGIGGVRSGTTSGAGGDSPNGGQGGPSSASGVTGVAGAEPGGGGGGGGGNGASGGAGANGRIVIEY